MPKDAVKKKAAPGYPNMELSCALATTEGSEMASTPAPDCVKSIENMINMYLLCISIHYWTFLNIQNAYLFGGK